MNDNLPLVSCIVPSYRRCDTLRRAIDSIISQTYENLEILIVDDNEKGDEFSVNLEAVVKEYTKDKRVRLITQDKHINGAVARNAGINASNGEYIAFLDDDDEWLPTKIEKQISFLLKNPQYGGVGCLSDVYCNNKLKTKGKINNKDISVFNILRRKVDIGNCAFLCRKDILLSFGGFDANLKRGQDLQLLSDFEHVSPIYVIQESLVKINADSVINRPTITNHERLVLNFLESRAYLLESMTKSERKRVYAAYFFEMAYVAFNNKAYLKTIKYLIRVGPNMKCYMDLYSRIKERKNN